ncbi:unnamed protein product [Closterium sp. NIES-64]|nr:unnamed protein product [Closterium sp. NIES-64]
MDKDAFASASSKKGWDDIERSCALMDSSNLQIDGIDLTDLLEEDDESQQINSTSEAELYEQRQLQDALDALHVSNGKEVPPITGNDSLAASFVVPWACLPPASTSSAAGLASSAASAVPDAASAARMQCAGSFNERPGQPMINSPPASVCGSVDPFLMKYRLDTQASSHSFGGLPSAAEDLVDSERTGEKGEEAFGPGRNGGMQGGVEGGWSAQEMALANSPVRNAALSMRVKAGANPAAVEAYLRMKAQRDGARTVRK